MTSSKVQWYLWRQCWNEYGTTTTRTVYKKQLGQSLKTTLTINEDNFMNLDGCDQIVKMTSSQIAPLQNHPCQYRVPVKCKAKCNEKTETKSNKTKPNETKRNETKPIETSTLQKVREFFRRQQFGIYWPDNSHLSIIIKYAKVVILSVV